MEFLFEESNVLNSPIECFLFDNINNCFPVRPHWHYFMEVIYMLEGKVQMNSGQSTYFMQPGDMIIFHPKVVHSIYATDNQPIKYAVFKFDLNRLVLTPSYSPKLRSIFKKAEKNSENIFFPGEMIGDFDAENIFLDCINEIKHKKYGYDLIIQSKIYTLLTKVLRYWQDRGFSIDNSTFVEDMQYDIYSITEYIDNHSGEDLRVSDIVKKCNMSYSFFAKRFKATYGKTCKEYIEYIRICKVENFLMFTDFDLNYISHETGFSDCSHMIKCFKKHRGITPKQFRKQLANTCIN